MALKKLSNVHVFTRKMITSSCEHVMNDNLTLPEFPTQYVIIHPKIYSTCLPWLREIHMVNCFSRASIRLPKSNSPPPEMITVDGRNPAPPGMYKTV